MPTQAKVLLTFYAKSPDQTNILKISPGPGSFTTGAPQTGALLFRFSGSAFAANSNGLLTLNLHWSTTAFSATNVPTTANKLMSIQTYANTPQQHMALVEGTCKITSYAANTTYYLMVSTPGTISPSVAGDQTLVDFNDFYGITVIEYPVI